MLDKQFDNIINQKLKDLKQDVPDSDWNVFSQKLKVAMESTGPEDHLFDEAIKSKLAAADIDVPKPEWSAFAALLNADTGAISDADFDAVINEKLQNPDIEIPKADWPVFAGMLAGNTATPDLSDSAFDNAIQNTLENNPMDIPTPNWNAFSQKLQEASLSDDQMDTEVKSKLENYSTRYNESHWPILREKMIETKYLRRNLYGLKWFEGALAILLFMTFANFIADKFIPDQRNSIAETVTTASSTVNREDVNMEASATIENTIIVAEAQNIAANNNNDSNSNNNTSTQNQASAANNIALTSTTGNGGGNHTYNYPTLESYSDNNSVSAFIPTKNLENNSLTNNSVEDQTNFTPTASLANVDKEQDVNILSMNSINGLNFGLLNHNRAPIDLGLETDPYVRISEDIATNGWALHAIIGNNNHLIDTPLDTFVYQEAYSRTSNNLNFDLRISKEFNQLELMTGIAYQTMQYGSRVTEEIEENGELYEFSLGNIKYDLIKIPVAARWNYGINDKFSFFADLGVSANILASSDYPIQAKLLESTSTIPKPQPIEELPEGVYASYENSSLAGKNYQQGIFNKDGASLKESIYGTLDTGIGINYQFNKQTETYVRATVNQALGQFEIGPNNDSFTTFGLQFGLKYSLRK